MKLRNKKTGEIIIFVGTEIHDGRVFFRLEDERGTFKREINSLAELNDEWEDVPEEPKDKGYWYIDDLCRMRYSSELLDEIDDRPNNWKIRELCSNYFLSREGAELAVRKLKAWKRLKDKGLTFCAWKISDDGCSVDIETTLDAEVIRAQQKHITDDLNLLFGGEE